MVATGLVSLKRSLAYSAILCGALAGCASTQQQQTSQAGLPSAQTNVPHLNTNPNTPGATSPAGGAAVASTAVQTQPQQAALGKSDRLRPGAGDQGQIQSVQARMNVPGATMQQPANPGTVAIAAVTNPPTANGAASVAGTQPAATSTAAAYASAEDNNLVPSVVAIPIPNPARPGDQALLPAATASSESDAAIPMTSASDMLAIQTVVPTPRPDEGGPSMRPAEVAYAAPSQIGNQNYKDDRPHYDFNFDTSGPTVVPATLSYSNYDSDVSPAEKSLVSKLIQKYSRIYDVPESLIHRVVHRESRYNPKAYNKAGYFGLMQIKYNTAKSMGYEGPPAGLLDAETNIKYAAKYLRGAWMVADGKSETKEADAVHLYARGYYYDAKRKGLQDIANGNY
jgi:soluble lytic murein transglycosylase-like protein